MKEKSIKSDLTRLDRMTDGDIDYSDIPPLDDSLFTKEKEPWPPSIPDNDPEKTS